MTTPKSLIAADLDDLLFSDRNRTYGAYELRKNYDCRLGAAFFATIILFSIIILLFSNSPGKKPLKDFFPVKPQRTDSGIVVDLHPFTDHQLKQRHINGYSPYVILTRDRDTNKNAGPMDKIGIGDGKLQGINASNEDVEGSDPLGLGRGGNRILALPKPKQYDSFPDRDAEFPGGFLAFETYLHHTIKYPNFAVESGIHGTISLAMKIDEYGRIADVAVI